MSEPHEEWSAQEPAPDFADKVMAQIDAGARAPLARSRGSYGRLVAGVAAGVALAAGLALAVTWHGGGAPTRGEAVAADRTQVAMGGRAVAVLERGAHVAWSGDEVEQSAGDVFYRVEPGGAFRVHTGAGDVAVLGTCFRVRVVGSEGGDAAMNGRDLKAGAIGAAVAAAAIVSVYEGKVAVSHAHQSVTLTAGETGRADSSGVRRASGAAGATGASAEGTGVAANEDPLVAANANLADSVREYKNRLEAIEGQKTEAEKQLADRAEEARDGHRTRARADREERVRPVARRLEGPRQERAHRRPHGLPTPDQWNVSPKALDALGLPPSDAQPIHDALQQSAGRIWATVRPAVRPGARGRRGGGRQARRGDVPQLVNAVAKQSEEPAKRPRGRRDSRRDRSHAEQPEASRHVRHDALR